MPIDRPIKTGFARKILAPFPSSVGPSAPRPGTVRSIEDSFHWPQRAIVPVRSDVPTFPLPQKLDFWESGEGPALLQNLAVSDRQESLAPGERRPVERQPFARSQQPGAPQDSKVRIKRSSIAFNRCLERRISLICSAMLEVGTTQRKSLRAIRAFSNSSMSLVVFPVPGPPIRQTCPLAIVFCSMINL